MLFIRILHTIARSKGECPSDDQISSADVLYSPETVLILRALSVFEQSYLQRSAIRLNEVVAQSVAGGARSPPAMGEGLSIARTATNELDAAKFDPLLVKAVAKNVHSSLGLLLTRLDSLVSQISVMYTVSESLSYSNSGRSSGTGGQRACSVQSVLRSKPKMHKLRRACIIVLHVSILWTVTIRKVSTQFCSHQRRSVL